MDTRFKEKTKSSNGTQEVSATRCRVNLPRDNKRMRREEMEVTAFYRVPQLNGKKKRDLVKTLRNKGKQGRQTGKKGEKCGCE